MMRQLALFTFIILSASCGEDTAEVTHQTIDQSDIIGYWDIAYANRSGKETATLVDSYIHFLSMDELKTNIFGEDQTQSYIWRDSVAMIADSSLSYRIDSVSTDSLHLSFRLQRHLFELAFFKNTLE